jgi:hypothetical protein
MTDIDRLGSNHRGSATSRAELNERAAAAARAELRGERANILGERNLKRAAPIACAEGDARSRKTIGAKRFSETRARSAAKSAGKG